MTLHLPAGPLLRDEPEHSGAMAPRGRAGTRIPGSFRKTRVGSRPMGDGAGHCNFSFFAEREEPCEANVSSRYLAGCCGMAGVRLGCLTRLE